MLETKTLPIQPAYQWTLLLWNAAIPCWHLLQQYPPAMEAAMMGNIVTSVVNTKTTTLQLSLSVLLNQKHKLIDKFHNFDVTSSYNELQWLKVSFVGSVATLPRLGLFDSTNGLVKVVVDNFDTKISSQYGQKSTHGVAMIITQSEQQKPGMSFEIELEVYQLSIFIYYQ